MGLLPLGVIRATHMHRFHCGSLRPERRIAASHVPIGVLTRDLPALYGAELVPGRGCRALRQHHRCDLADRMPRRHLQPQHRVKQLKRMHRCECGVLRTQRRLRNTDSLLRGNVAEPDRPDGVHRRRRRLLRSRERLHQPDRVRGGNVAGPERAVLLHGCRCRLLREHHRCHLADRVRGRHLPALHGPERLR